MHLIRRFGMYLSLTIISVVHAVRYWTSFRTSSIQGVRVILVKDRSVVLVTHWYAPWTWTLPGGGVNNGETPEAAAMRAALGRKASQEETLGRRDPPVAGREVIEVVAKLRVGGGLARELPDDEQRLRRAHSLHLRAKTHHVELAPVLQQKREEDAQ